MCSVVVMIGIVVLLLFLLGGFMHSISEGYMYLIEVDLLRIINRFEGLGRLNIGG